VRPAVKAPMIWSAISPIYGAADLAALAAPAVFPRRSAPRAVGIRPQGYSSDVANDGTCPWAPQAVVSLQLDIRTFGEAHDCGVDLIGESRIVARTS
jgi:hypothetical protein